MTITERTLRKWRKEALKYQITKTKHPETFSTSTHIWRELQERILRLTQELLDQHLLRK